MVENPHLVFIPKESAEFLCGLLFTELSRLIAESKKDGHTVDRTKLEFIQAEYNRMRKHRQKLLKLTFYKS